MVLMGWADNKWPFNRGNFFPPGTERTFSPPFPLDKPVETPAHKVDILEVPVTEGEPRAQLTSISPKPLHLKQQWLRFQV